MKRAILAMALCALLSGTAHAVTRAEVAACHPDAVHLCGVTPADNTAGILRKAQIGLCILNHREQLRPPCRAVLKAHGY